MSVLLVLVGLLLLGGAAGLVSLSFRTRNRGLLGGAAVSAVLGLIVIFISMSLISVGPSERLVVLNKLTGNLQDARGPGFVFINPITESYTTYDISLQTYTMSTTTDEGDIYGDDAVQARTQDSQEVAVDLTVIFSLDPENLDVIRQDWPNNTYRDDLIRPTVREVVRDVIGDYSANEVTPKREEISEVIQQRIIEELQVKNAPTGLLVREVLLRNITFSPEYTAAIEAASVAEQRIREEQFNVQTEQEIAKQLEERAKGEANARRIQAQAEADALELIAEVLRENPELLEYTYVQNLSDNVSIIALPANSPYLFDLQSMIGNLPTPQAEE